MLDAQINLLRLLQLSSPTLPVGAYSYSQAMEHAVESGAVRDEASASQWIEDVYRFSFEPLESAALVHMLAAARTGDTTALIAANEHFLACRETAELRAETIQMGRSLARLLETLPLASSTSGWLREVAEPTYPCVWACAAIAFGLADEACRTAYTWAWLENQVLAAIKLVPLGQSAGQRMLLHLAAIAARNENCTALPPARWSNFAPGLALASALHETQYSRLFRS